MDTDARDRNVRAHEGLDRIPFPHRTINQIALRTIEEHFRRTGSHESGHPRVLDVGCGAGFLLQVMLDRKWDAWGIDPYPRGAALESPLRERIPGGTVDSLDGTGFHAVTAIEVLEHIEDYTGLLLSMYRQLRPGGIMVVTVPHDWAFHAVDSPDGSLEPKYGHLWRFRTGDLAADLEQLASSARITPIYSRELDRRRYLFTRVMPISWVMRLSESLVRKNADGAWLLGTVTKEDEGEGNPIPEMLKKPTTLHYRDFEPFNTTLPHERGEG